MRVVFTEVQYGTKTFRDGIELINTVDVVLARSGDKESQAKIDAIIERNKLRSHKP